MPNAAILLASYNGEKYIEEQLKSIQKQTYRDFRCYIRDDGSSDHTVEIIKSFVKEDPEHFILITTESVRHGSKYNFFELINYYMRSCNEEYILFSDQDDVWLPEKVAVEIEQISSTDRPALAFCAQEIVDKKLVPAQNSIHKNMKDYNKFPNSLTYRNVAAGCTMCVNRELLLKAIPVVSPDDFVMHDWWLMLVAAYLGRIIYIEEPLMKYRQHGNNVLGADSNNYFSKAQKYIKNFNKSIHSRKTQAELCQRQMQKLLNLVPKDSRLMRYSAIMSKPAAVRAVSLVKNSYIEPDNLFTCLFV
ncbi:glycosyltransferase family 2 protein [Bilifractor sp. HCP3S3_D3]|uniref:glycosyltransferase family 2 protein n=1 Tax=Bilifractor sp. HCP3S3_D3 TaxID=3438907 RepID=UPI003F8B3F54